jgi:hypothetical protein
MPGSESTRHHLLDPGRAQRAPGQAMGKRQACLTGKTKHTLSVWVQYLSDVVLAVQDWSHLVGKAVKAGLSLRSD